MNTLRRICSSHTCGCVLPWYLFTAVLPEGQRPAEPATEKSPQGFAAVNWGFWQLFRRPDPDAQEEADPEEQDSDDDDDDGGQAAAATAATDEEEEEQDRWYRGVVQWFDKKTKQYWVRMQQLRSA